MQSKINNAPLVFILQCNLPRIKYNRIFEILKNQVEKFLIFKIFYAKSIINILLKKNQRKSLSGHHRHRRPTRALFDFKLACPSNIGKENSKNVYSTLKAHIKSSIESFHIWSGDIVLNRCSFILVIKSISGVIYTYFLTFFNTKYITSFTKYIYIHYSFYLNTSIH